MIERDEIEGWVNSGESETSELKRSTGERKEAAKSLCAMLNHRGGRVIFGVESNGRIVGQQVSDNTIEHLCQTLNEIEPSVTPTIDRIDISNGLEVLVVRVETGHNKPYTYQHQAYRRVGNTNHTLSRHEYNQMLIERMHGERRWEDEPASGWTEDFLDDTEIVRIIREAVQRGRLEHPGSEDPHELLRGLGLTRNGQILRAAAVLFGRSNQVMANYPQCLLRVARFRGTDKTEFLDNRQFHGNAFSLLRRAERFLLENLPVAGRITPGLFERVDDPLYPPIALREALANAFCHRDYSVGGGSVAVAIYDDRLEITSSGTLHFGLTAEALFLQHESLPWNPRIARVFYLSGIIESWGRGIIKMVELATEAGLPEPEIEEAGGCVTVRFRPSQYIPPQRIGHNLNERQRDVLRLLDGALLGLAFGEIASHFKAEATYRQVRRDLEILRSLRLISSEGRGRGARWRLLQHRIH